MSSVEFLTLIKSHNHKDLYLLDKLEEDEWRSTEHCRFLIYDREAHLTLDENNLLTYLSGSGLIELGFFIDGYVWVNLSEQSKTLIEKLLLNPPIISYNPLY